MYREDQEEFDYLNEPDDTEVVWRPRDVIDLVSEAEENPVELARARRRRELSSRFVPVHDADAIEETLQRQAEIAERYRRGIDPQRVLAEERRIQEEARQRLERARIERELIAAEEEALMIQRGMEPLLQRGFVRPVEYGPAPLPAGFEQFEYRPRPIDPSAPPPPVQHRIRPISISLAAAQAARAREEEQDDDDREARYRYRWAQYHRRMADYRAGRLRHRPRPPSRDIYNNEFF